MNSSEKRIRGWQRIAVVMTLVAAASPSLIGQTPMLVLAPKAKSPGWTGVHRPHTALAGVLARHKGQADWAETVVEDESLSRAELRAIEKRIADAEARPEKSDRPEKPEKRKA